MQFSARYDFLALLIISSLGYVVSAVRVLRTSLVNFFFSTIILMIICIGLLQCSDLPPSTHVLNGTVI